MTTRQSVEIVCLAAACIASVRTWFWNGPAKKLGILLAVIVFVLLSLFIAYH